MDLRSLVSNLGLSAFPTVLRKAMELQRLSKVRFNSSSFGLGEVCKSVLCVELACRQLNVEFDRRKGIRIAGMSEKSYIRSLNHLQNALGLRLKVDVRELAIQFGCVRMVNSVTRAMAQFRQRFVASLPESRKESADFNRPVFTAVAFYLCAKRNKLKVDKLRLIEFCGTSESEFSSVSASMLDLCFDLVGLEKEKKMSSCGKELLQLHSKKRKATQVEAPHSDEESDGEEPEIVQLLKRSRACEVF